MEKYRTSSHTTYDIKYHICWITKYRYRVLQGKIIERLREILKQECQKLDVMPIVSSINQEHVHILVSVPPDLSVSKLVQQLKGNSSIKLQREFSQELRKRYWGRHLWARGFFAVSSGNVTDSMWIEYIKNQGQKEQQELIEDQKRNQAGKNLN